MLSFDSSTKLAADITLVTSNITSNSSVTISMNTGKATEQAIFLGDCNPETAQWEPVTNTRTIDLAGTDGLRTVSVLFRDAHDFRSECLSQTITLDRQGPQTVGSINLSSNFSAQTMSPLISFTPAVDITTSVDHYEMRLIKSSDSSEIAPWTNIGNNTQTAQLTGLTLIEGQGYIIEVRGIDIVGNLGAVRQSAVFQGGPFLDIVIASTPLLSGIYKIRFQLSSVATSTISFQYATADQTAFADLDYSPLSGTGTILTGQSYYDIFIDINNRPRDGTHATFKIAATNVVHAAANQNYTVITVNNPAADLTFGPYHPLSLVEDISLKVGFFCVTRSNGSVYCAGQDTTFAALGTGHVETVAFPQPAIVADSVAVGQNGGCARQQSDGTLRCWGGTLAVKEYGVAPAYFAGASVFVTTDAVTSYSTGFGHSCFIKNNFDIFCTGDNSYYQYGTTTASSAGFSLAFNDPSLSQVHVGQYTTCFLSNATIKCVGDNRKGLLGLSPVTLQSQNLSTIPSLTQVASFDLNYQSACAINNGQVWCWGDNTYGQAGLTPGGYTATPHQITLPDTAVAVAVGERHACAALLNKSIYCWGSNELARLGQSIYEVTQTPKLVTVAAASVVKLVAGQSTTCYLDANKIPYCWGGHATAGALAQPGPMSKYLPKDYNLNIGTVTKLKSGRNLMCALNSLKKLYCWGGTNPYLANAMTNHLIHSYLPVAYLNSYNITDFSVGATHVCGVVETTGQVVCAGKNNRGQLGDGTLIDNLNPSPVTGLTGAVSVAVTTSTSCALLSNGEIKCWGDNFRGQCRSGINRGDVAPFASALNTTFVDAIFLGNKVELVSSEASFCTRSSLGEIYCWGWNAQGQFGDGTNYTYGAGAQVLNVTNPISLSGGGYHFCATEAAGTVKCWGTNYTGEIGSNQTLGSGFNPTPQILNGVTSPLKIAAGTFHTCIVNSSGQPACQGYGWDSTLGLDSTANASAPQLIPHMEGDVVDIVVLTTSDESIYDGTVSYQIPGFSSSNRSVCAVSSRGNIKCWGAMFDGINTAKQNSYYNSPLFNISVTPITPWFAL